MLFLGAGNAEEYVPRWQTLEHTERRISKYATTRHTYTVQCTNPGDVQPTNDNVERLFTSVVNSLTVDLDQGHYVGLTLQSPSLAYPISMPYTRLRDFKAADIMAAIQKTINSNEDFAIDGRLKIELTHVEIPQGRGLNGTGKSYNFIN